MKYLAKTLALLAICHSALAAELTLIPGDSADGLSELPAGCLDVRYHLRMDALERRHFKEPAAETGLIGYDGDSIIGCAQTRNRVDAPRQRTPLVSGFDVVVGVVVDDAVAVENDDLAGCGHPRERRCASAVA